MNEDSPEKGKVPTPLQRIGKYFQRRGWKPFPFQKTCWRMYQAGDSGIVHSATGTGKTLAVWLGPILKWVRENPNPDKWNPKRPPPIRVLWITPIRALASDTEFNLRDPIDQLGLPWKVESRTGDSGSSTKSRQLRRLPTALITTPESLSLLLTHEKSLEQLSGLESIVIDEWHELMGTKRGVQTELCMARLRKLNPKLQTWALSATLGNLDQAVDALVGNENLSETQIIEGYQKKKIVFESIIPNQIERFPWTGHIGTKMSPQVADYLESVNNALIFTNTRAQTEIWYQEILKQRPQWAGKLALHHGSLDSDVRKWVEQGLQTGKLKAVVCTSSLDLGVDFTSVDLVVQVGSPKGAARLLQRAGRSGHQPDAVSKLAFVPTNAIELIELAAAQQAIKENDLESRKCLSKPLDLLAQHAISIAIGGGFTSEELFDEVRSTYTYHSLTKKEWDWVLNFIQFGGDSLNAYPDFKRVLLRDGRYQVTDRKVMTAHRMNIGTITADSSMVVKYLSGKRLGMVEETFLSRLETDDIFTFAGKQISLVRIKDNIAYVRKAKGKPNTVPRWMGGRMPLSAELGEHLRKKLDEAAKGIFRGPEMKTVKPLLHVQKKWSMIPSADQMLVESIKTKVGWQVFVYSFEGRLVHEGLAALAAYRLSKSQRTTFSLACNDYGFVLQSPKPVDLQSILNGEVFRTDSLLDDIMQSMNSTEMSKRQFRQIARIAGLIQQGLPHRQKTAKHLMASSNLFFDVFCTYDPSNLLLEQARREVLEQQLESDRILSAVDRIRESEIVHRTPERLTPLAFPLLVDKLRERLSSETLADRVARMQRQLEKAAG